MGAMRPIARWLSLVVSLNLAVPVTVMLPKAASAQGKKPKTMREDLRAELRKDWVAALTHFGDGNFRGAIVQFQRVYDATKNPRILKNIGRAYQDDKKAAKAVVFYQRALAEGATVLSPAEVAEINAAITDLKPLVSTIEIQVNEPGSAVTVDGEDVGRSPLAKAVDVAVGDHDIVVSKDGWRAQTRRVSVARGTPAVAKFELVPERLMTMVTVSAEGAPKANIRIDSIEMGAAPFKGQVEVGKRHKFEAYAPNYATAEQSLDITKQESEPLKIVLRMSEARSEGRVAIIARPAGAIIEVDQKVVGTDKWEGVLPAGGHNITIKKDGYITHQQEIGVANDQVRTVETTLRQDSSRGAVVWVVGAALVVIGGGVTAFFVARSKDGEPVRGTVTNPDNGIMPTWLRR